MAMCAPRIRRNGSPLSFVRSTPFSRTSPPAIRPGSSMSPRIEYPVTLLPEPGFTDETKNAAARHLEGHAVHGLDDSAPNDELGAKILDAENGPLIDCASG